MSNGDTYRSMLYLGGTAITSFIAELNLLDGSALGQLSLVGGSYLCASEVMTTLHKLLELQLHQQLQNLIF